MPDFDDPLIEKQWQEWKEANPPETFKNIDFSELTSRTIADLTYVSGMDVREYTLYQKWNEIRVKYPTVESTLFGDRCLVSTKQANIIAQVKSNFWIPESPDDYLKLKPALQFTDDTGIEVTTGLDGSTVETPTKRNKKLSEIWNTVRVFCSTMRNNSNIGRNLYFMVVDEVTGKYLGQICISSDFMDLTPRDKFIGWSRDIKTEGRMINHTAIGSTIIPLQPFGYNYVGGKLLSLLCLSDDIQKLWKEKYGDFLAAVTTTSLYGNTKAGGLSQYNGLEYWQPMGFTSGSVSYEPEIETRKMINEWLKANHTKKYFEWFIATNDVGQPHKRDHKFRSLNFAYSKMNVPANLIRSAHQRGIYFTPLYDKSCEYLCGKVEEKDLKKSFDTSVESLSNIWLRHAKGRISQLKKQNKVSYETLCYDDLIYLDWNQTKEKYLPQIGR